MDLNFDYSFYSLEFKSSSLNLEEFEILYSRCFDMINLLASNFNSIIYYPKDIMYFKKAVCSQIEYVFSLGGFDALYSSGVSSVSIGDFKYSSNSNGVNTLYSPIAIEFIKAISGKVRGCDLYE